VWTPYPANDPSKVTAVLGPTNTGKTHYAIERMLAQPSGMIGLPLRLLAREVYDRVVAVKGPDVVGLVTGEERILPKDVRYRICTVEAMPRGLDVDFLAVDEIQLAADPERGHVFTDRLLNARGRFETLFLGSETMASTIRALLPGVEIISRPRLSNLTYAGPRKLSRLPRRSAIVAFSAEEVYALAELVRRQRGGAAVVMGALSPRTRNAQVALYQSGEVDFLVATDAIGMGLNMDIDHVAFAGLRKFDGAQHRPLRSHEIAQIAGRAGRHTRDGTFGSTADAGMLDPDNIDRVETHRFEAVKALQWRNSELDFSGLPGLIKSLEMPPSRIGLTRAREADDILALKALSRDEGVRARSGSGAALRLLWDVCQVPDFVRMMAEEHTRLLGRLFDHLTSPAGVIPNDWIAESLTKLDDVEGDIDSLAHRLSHVRTWTFISNRAQWLKEPALWQQRARAVEDRLSDALHTRLTQRFVDRRTSVLMRRLRQREDVEAVIDDGGDVLVEGEFVGRLNGFQFEADPRAGHDGPSHSRALKGAALPAMRRAITAKVAELVQADDSVLDLNSHGRILYHAAPIAQLGRGPSVLKPKITVLGDDLLDARDRIKVEARIQAFLDKKISSQMGRLPALINGPGLSGLARGIAYRLVENLGILPRLDDETAETLRALDGQRRAELRRLGVVFGESAVHVPALLKPAATRLKLTLWAIHQGLADPPSPPPPGVVNIPVDPTLPPGYYLVVGYKPMGGRAIRIDMLERLSQIVRALDDVGPFCTNPDMMALLGAGEETLFEVLEALGFRRSEALDESGKPVIHWRRKPDRRRDHRRPPQKAAAAPRIEQRPQNNVVLALQPPVSAPAPDGPFAALAALVLPPPKAPPRRQSGGRNRP
jgi:ATP-dependent RNA helicase SUPV3L1/SUV3